MIRTTPALFILICLAALSLVPGQNWATSENEQGDATETELLSPEKAYHALDDRFFAGDNGIITDTKTGLEWYEGPDKDTTWDEGKAWVESLSLDGGGWRMPRREELGELYKKGAGTTNKSPLFKTTGGFVWTGETVSSSHAWGFCFDIGADYWPRRSFSDTARVFAVRKKKQQE